MDTESETSSPTTINVAICMTPERAAGLRHLCLPLTRMVRDHPDRFELLLSGEAADSDIDEGRWADATLHYTDSMVALFLLEAFEQASGFDTLLLWDVAFACEGADAFVMLSTRPDSTD